MSGFGADVGKMILLATTRREKSVSPGKERKTSVKISSNVRDKIVELALCNRKLTYENKQLMMECDDKQARIEALEAQIMNLGGIPTQYSWLDRPWTGAEIEGHSVVGSSQGNGDMFDIPFPPRVSAPDDLRVAWAMSFDDLA